jgi:hypothetical protein
MAHRIHQILPVMTGFRCRLNLADIATVRRCGDPSLPKGYAMWVSLHSQPQGHYYIAGGSLHKTSELRLPVHWKTKLPHPVN